MHDWSQKEKEMAMQEKNIGEATVTSKETGLVRPPSLYLPLLGT